MCARRSNLERHQAKPLHRRYSALRNADSAIFYTILLVGVCIDAKPFTISSLDSPPRRLALATYIARGAKLRGLPWAAALSEHLRGAQRESNDDKGLRCFYYVGASSSGAGKTQLAFSLDSPVVYVPLAEAQRVYQAFTRVAIEFEKTLAADGQALSWRSGELQKCSMKLKTVGLLYSLAKAVRGLTNAESLCALSGYNGDRVIWHSPMSLREAREKLATLFGSGPVPLFYIDELPPAHHPTFKRCILLRNIIRCMRCVCVLSSTEPAAMFVVDTVFHGTRRFKPLEHVRLIAELPSTVWPAFAEDPRYAELVGRLSPETVRMLAASRPLFVEYTLDALLEQQQTQGIPCLSASGLSALKKRILNEKYRYCSSEGLYPQLALLYPQLQGGVPVPPAFESLRRLSKKCKAGLTAAEADEIISDHCLFYLRHNFAQICIDSAVRRVAATVVPVYIPAVGRLVVLTDSGEFSAFPRVKFATPRNDALLYLICLRDGVHGKPTGAGSARRYSTAFALHALRAEQPPLCSALSVFLPAMRSADAAQEVELSMAAIVASHSYPEGAGQCGDGGLQGCPLSFFLRAVVAELNPMGARTHVFPVSPRTEYVPAGSFTLTGIPPEYDSVRVGLLSPLAEPWLPTEDSEGPSTGLLLDGTLVLSDVQWNTSGDTKHGCFPVLLKGAETTAATGALACCSAASDLVVLVARVAKEAESSGHLVTVLAAVGAVDETNVRLSAAAGKAQVVRVGGNASAAAPVATQLVWQPLGGHPADGRGVGGVSAHTVVILALSTIYWGRGALYASY
jgi:hypothetical protein